MAGPVAQWITRLTMDQKIPGSNPGRFDVFFGSTTTQSLSRMPGSWQLVVRDVNISPPVRKYTYISVQVFSI